MKLPTSGPRIFSIGIVSGADHMHVDIPRAERCRHLETDEARADHHGAPRCQSLGDKSAAVRERAQIVHVREIAAGDLEPHRVGAGGEQQRAIGMPAAIRELYVPAPGVDRGDACTQLQVDVVLSVEFRRSEEIRLCRTRCRRDSPSIGWVDRRASNVIGAQHRDAAGVALVTKRFRSGVAGRATTDDNDRLSGVPRASAGDGRLAFPEHRRRRSAARLA